jgi:aldose 1-epimerase
MYAMAPWAGRLNDNTVHFDGTAVEFAPTYGPWALHGTVLEAPCSLQAFAQEAHSAVAQVVCDLGNPWPWSGMLVMTWDLRPDLLTTTLELRTHDGHFPGVIGWHPWFRRHTGFGSADWHLEEALLVEKSPDLSLRRTFAPAPMERGGFDDTFLVESGRGAIGWGDGLRIAVWNSHPWFVVYDADPAFICLEPQSGPPNGINDALVREVVRVTPTQPLVQRTTWQVSRVRPVG